MESQPQNPEFRNNLKNFHPCIQTLKAQVSHGITELNINQRTYYNLPNTAF